MVKQRAATLAAIVLAGALVVVFAAGLHKGATLNGRELRVGDPVPRTDLIALDAGDVHFTTRAWRGRSYIVHFFASWCVDCKNEHEELMTLAAGHVPIIGIAFKDSADRIASYLEREGNPFAAVAIDKDSQTESSWGLSTVPETFVVDSYGIVRWHNVGPLSDNIVTNELMPAWESVETAP